MKKHLSLLTVALLFICYLFAQNAANPEKLNFNSFASPKAIVTAELDSLTPGSLKNHPDYGVLPYDAPCRDCFELLQKRDENHRYYVRQGSKGRQFIQESSYGIKNYRDEAGRYIAVDPRIKQDGKGIYKASHQVMPVTLNMAEHYTSISNDGREFKFNNKVTLYIKHPDGSVESLGQPSWTNYTAGDNGVLVHNFYPGIDLELRTNEGSIESNYRINRPLGLKDGWLVVHDNLDVPSGLTYDYSYTEKKDLGYEGMLFFNNAAAHHDFIIASPAAYDENGTGNNEIALQYTTDGTGNFEIYMPVSWMNDPARSYPLVIDPVVVAQSTLPLLSITGSGYNATCFTGGCTYTLPTVIPPFCKVRDMKFSFRYQALGTCHINQGAFDISYNGCRTNQYTCSSALAGLCQNDSLQIDSTAIHTGFQDCLGLTPQCASYTIPFVLTFYRCTFPAAPGNCGFSCITAVTPWDMFVEGQTIEVTATGGTVCQGSCVNVSATATYGVTPYSFKWYPGGITGNPACVSPNATTTYTVTAFDCNGSDSAQATAVVTVKLNDNPGFNMVPSVCQNMPVTLTANGAAAASNYNWILPGSNLGSANGTKTVNNVTYSTPGNHYVILNYLSANGCTFADTMQISVTPAVTPSVSITSPVNSICQGASLTFTANVNNGGNNPAYQWYINGVQVNGAVNSTYTTTALNNGNVITVHIKSNANCAQPDSAVSNGITMTVTPLAIPTVSISANPNTPICPGDNITFTASPTNQGTAPTYVWYLNGAQVGGNSITYSSAGLKNGDVIIVHLLHSNVLCASPDSAVSNTITIVVKSQNAPTINITSNPSGPICPGTSVTFTATITYGGSSPAYQWYLNGAPVGPGGSTFTSSTLNNNDIITVHLRNAVGPCIFPDSAVSNQIQIIYSTSIIPSVTISANPSGSICPGTNVTFTAVPNNQGSTPAYQWYVNGGKVGAGGTSYSSATLQNGDVITVHLLHAIGPCISPDSAVSNTITIVYSAAIVPAVTISASPSGSICPGTNVTFTASPANAGSSPTYKWYINGVFAGAGVTFSSSTLNNGDLITAILHNAVGPCIAPDTAVSNALQVTYSPAIAPSVSIVANPPGSICPGDNVTFTALPANAGASPTYKWYINGILSGAGTTFSSISLNNGDIITAILHNASGPCISPDTAVSNSITIIYSAAIPPSVSIAANPPGSICPGTSVTFTPTPTNGGSSPSYQWYLNGNPVVNTVTYTSSTLNNGDVITVHLLHAVGPCIAPDTAVSNAITIRYSPPIRPAVIINVSPSDSICPGSSVTFTASPANGGTSPSYQWYINGVAVAGTNATYTSNALSDGAVVLVHLLHAVGPCIAPDTAVSNSITIHHKPVVPPTATITASPSNTICPTENITFTAVITNGGNTPGYQWYLNGNQVGTNSPVYSSTTFKNGDVILVHLLNAVLPCVAPDTAVSNSITVVYKPKVIPTVNITANPPGVLCQGESVTITATQTGGGNTPVYKWYINAVLQQNNGTSYTSNSLKNGDIISVILKSSDLCADPDSAVSNTIVIQVNPPMTVVAAGDTTICPGESVPITATAGGGQGAPYSYSWDNGAGTDSNATVTPVRTTIYTVSASDGCHSTPATDQVTVVVSPVPVPIFTYTPSEPTEYARTVYFSNLSQGANSWNWTFDDPSTGSDDSSALQNPTHTFSGIGTYKVRLVVKNSAGCIDSITLIVEVTEEYAFYFPNAFTPNGDGINDQFGPQGTHDLIYDMVIFNRWGEKIFETNGTSLPWTGYVNGKLAENGIYIYKVKFKNYHYGNKEIIGSVTLIR